MKHENPIEELWRIRDELGAAEGYDVNKLFERLRRAEANYAGRLVRVAPRRARGDAHPALREEPPPYGQDSGGKK
jgi:hypothetical protein